jgi:hypothetical protein
MARSKKEKTNRMLSPENYMRQRARSLPLHECFVNSDWKSAKMATLFVSRRHTNGNFSVGIYLADLFCQGVKDTGWRFNISAPEYESFVETLSEKKSMEKIPYVLAHNIIFAAHEFAGECGIDSHPDFTGTTRFILEEDSDEIELIDIECGEDGVPVFMNSPGQSQAQALRIIGKLDKTIGAGNYEVRYMNMPDEDFDDDFDEDFDEDEQDVSEDDMDEDLMNDDDRSEDDK